MIGHITKAGVITQYNIPSPNNELDGITEGPDEAVWFTEFSGNKIGRITTAGVITNFAIPTSGSVPTGMTVETGGKVWFTEFAGNKIGVVKLPCVCE
jgi:virginiamycin B lyase